MPYIKKEDRDAVAVSAATTAGELNYEITQVILEYLYFKGPCYQTINDILGALDGASKEFYRRIVVPYEDEKIKENGDVY